ncbi:MAG: DUF4388 domain-containing protein, partial [Acidobacteriota bacterium]
ALFTLGDLAAPPPAGAAPSSTLAKKTTLGHYFILDREATFAIAMQEALEIQGHSAEIFQEPLTTLTALLEFGADVLILDLGVAALGARQLVGTFNDVPELRSLPIVGLSESSDSAYAVELLNLGLTDVLPRSQPLEELIIRITRGAGQPTADLPMMQGRLAKRQLLDFLEYLRHLGKSGVLRITSTGGAGRIDVYRGAIAGARFKHLRGQSAVLAMLDQETGKFKLGAPSGEGGGASIDMQTVLLKAAWLADKLRKYEQWVPRSGHEFVLASRPSSDSLGEDADALPLDAVLDLAEARSTVRLHDLERDIDAPPQSLRLALAMLAKEGHLRLRTIEPPASTKELKSHLGIQYSILDLLQRAGHRGGSLSLVLLAEPEGWPDLRGMFKKLQGPPFDELNQSLDQRDAGTLSLATEGGVLTLTMQQIDTFAPDEARSTAAAADGLALWLGPAADPKLLTGLLDQVTSTPDVVRGVVVAAHPDGVEWCRRAVADRPEWLLSLHPPTRLSSLLRCFYSRAEGS